MGQKRQPEGWGEGEVLFAGPGKEEREGARSSKTGRPFLDPDMFSELSQYHKNLARSQCRSTCSLLLAPRAGVARGWGKL